jgi:hypothetical protein
MVWAKLVIDMRHKKPEFFTLFLWQGGIPKGFNVNSPG